MSGRICAVAIYRAAINHADLRGVVDRKILANTYRVIIVSYPQIYKIKLDIGQMENWYIKGIYQNLKIHILQGMLFLLCFQI